MLEYYFPEAVVLAKDDIGEADSRVFLYARDFGKLIAKARSARKITSKLSSHLEPGNLIQVRLVEKNGLQVADALKVGKLGVDFTDLFFLNEILHEADYDSAIWEEITNKRVQDVRIGRTDRDDRVRKNSLANNLIFNWTKILRILGWDPEQTNCGICKKNRPYSFDINNQSFICENCAFDIPNLPRSFWGRTAQFIKI